MNKIEMEEHIKNTEIKLKRLLRPDNREDQAYIAGYMGGMLNILKVISNED